MYQQPQTELAYTGTVTAEKGTPPPYCARTCSYTAEHAREVMDQNGRHAGWQPARTETE